MRLLRPVLLLLVFLFTACATSSSTPPPETESTLNTSKPQLPGYAIKRSKKAPYALVLVHGITGDGISSWTSQKGTYWPTLMEGDQAFENFDVYVYEYPTSLFGECMAVSDLATNMYAHLKSDSVFESHENVIFLAHSMGGLIVRTFLLRYRETADKVPMLIFFATPSAGSQKANVGNLLPTCSQVEDLRTLDINSFLKNQQNDWFNSTFQDRIASYCAVETRGSTVSRSSASLLCTKEPLPLPTDHSDAVKPETTRDLPHIFLKNSLSDLPALQKQLLANVLRTPPPPSNNKKVENNRRTQLLQKLSQEYILSHDNLSSALLAGTEWPPLDWMNKRLKELGEPWSVMSGKNSMELRFSERMAATDADDHANPILQWGTSEPGTNSSYVVVNTRILKRYDQDYRMLVLYRAHDSHTEARDDTRIIKSELFGITGERKAISTKLGQDFMRRLIPSRVVQIYLLLLPNHISSDSVISVNDAISRGAVLAGTRAMQVSAVSDEAQSENRKSN